jgi:hypothetical protein
MKYNTKRVNGWGYTKKKYLQCEDRVFTNNIQIPINQLEKDKFNK